MKLSFHGAARTVTGSKHLIHLDNGKKILLDCGLFQGLGRDTLRLNSDWGFDPTEITYVILSHAHIDHVGLLPKLVKDGFNGKIICTTPTADLATMLVRDSARIQEMDVRYINQKREKQGCEPVETLYTEEDAEKLVTMMYTLENGEPYQLDKDVELLYTDCGHVLGASAIHLKITEDGTDTRITFSGDVGRYRDVILRAPDPFPQADYIIMESTYGDKLHDILAPSADQLLRHIKETCIEQGGNLIIPAFSVGRTQEVLYLLNRLELERRLPDLNYFVDSPLSIDATRIIKAHPECFNPSVRDILKKDDDVFAFKGLHYVESAEESMALASIQEPCVIISSSGMAEAGRVKHHIANNIEDPKSKILIVGYCEPSSLGSKLKNGAKQVSIFGDEKEVAAGVAEISSMSAHGDYDDLLQWLSCQDPERVKKLFLVHGEYEVQVNFRERLLRKGYGAVEIPAQHDVVTLNMAEPVGA
jgi:metallo-beta-lactamase family protein